MLFSGSGSAGFCGLGLVVAGSDFIWEFPNFGLLIIRIILFGVL